MKIYIDQFSNKLKLVTVDVADSNSISIVVFIKVGSRFEKKAFCGISHFVEHNFFKGTKDLPKSKDIAVAIENLGGTSNAFTSYEYTGYYIKVPKENADRGVEILSDMIKNSTFPEEEIEKERGVVIEEIRMNEDIPMRKVANVFMAQLFGDHPLGRDIAGNIETVSRFTRNDILEFTKKHYIGENIVVCIAGGINYENIKSRVSELFGDIKKGKGSVYKKFKKRDLSKNKYKFIKKAVEQTHIVIGGFGLPNEIEKRYALQVGLAILGRGLGSKLFQKIREELGLAYYIQIDHSGLYETGEWDVSLGVDNKRVIEAIRAVFKELSDFKQGKFNKDDIDRARNFILGNLITQMEATDDLAIWHGLQELLLGYIDDVQKAKSKVKKVTKDDILEVWNEILIDNNYIITALTSNENINIKSFI